MRFSFLIFLLFFSTASFAGMGPGCLSPEEFKKLGEDVSHKIDLFQKVWSEDSSAQFFGGTSRDFFYWIKGHFKSAQTREQCLAIAEELRARGTIPVREFMSEESDIDVVTKKKPFPLDATEFGVKKIDSIDSDRFNPATEFGQNEINQGFIPIEKIRLSKKGIVDSKIFGDGIHEIYTSKITVKFAEPAAFANTLYARMKINHPILLATRYIRALSLDVYHREGRGLPNLDTLFDIDEESMNAVKNVIKKSIGSHNLEECLEQPKFVQWLRDTSSKSFRAYVNPTATFEYYKYFKMTEWIEKYPRILDPINQNVFAKFHDLKLIENHISALHFPNESEWIQKASDVIPEGRVYHGTPNQKSFNSILHQGALPSAEDRFVGGGLYAVQKTELQVAQSYAHGNKDLVAVFPIKPEARVVDITQGVGKKVFENYLQMFQGADHDKFADLFGIDVIKYDLKFAPFNGVPALAVKNSAVLGVPFGFGRQTQSFAQLMNFAKNIRNVSELNELIKNAQVSNLVEREWILLLNNVNASDIDLSSVFALNEQLRSIGMKSKMRTQFLATAVADECIRMFLTQITKGVEEKTLSHLFSTYGQAMNDLANLKPEKKELATYVSWTQKQMKSMKPEKQMLYLDSLTDIYSKRTPKVNVVVTEGIRFHGKALTFIPFMFIANIAIGIGLTHIQGFENIGYGWAAISGIAAYGTKDLLKESFNRFWTNGLKPQLDQAKLAVRSSKTKDTLIELLQAQMQAAQPTCSDTLKKETL